MIDDSESKMRPELGENLGHGGSEAEEVPNLGEEAATAQRGSR